MDSGRTVIMGFKYVGPVGKEDVRCECMDESTNCLQSLHRTGCMTEMGWITEGTESTTPEAGTN